MAGLTIVQTAGYWVGAGGPRNRVVAWVAVAFAESSLDTAALSPVGAMGLWQIMPANFPGLGLSAADGFNPHVNALAAVRLSGGGMNFAPWDTAYADILASGRFSFLGWPQPGSAAFNNMPTVAGALRGGFGIQGGSAPQPGITGSLPSAINWYDRASYRFIPAMISATARIQAASARLYKGK